mmetsp:Transcript_14260/g.28768  ORF Transcript_14260/g.28768 Transcript_14260/m.28768 type:complete len:254 (-) Transcript_14260:164-925(-)|eukprot:CAMPEP_0167785102 /NCGR_PEP_ID=MMETSP0111_2-20121227/8054_1 /TAXON_ID=91324 /ORGANISM="Lotharella globosa, Strain CCCM811" /LENGTH=253 /DNA_ID=CAMNT_0007676343 /DNA_START=271 /DNA_END=1032 /DNA_ORIENTATION=-
MELLTVDRIQFVHALFQKPGPRGQVAEFGKEHASAVLRVFEAPHFPKMNLCALSREEVAISAQGALRLHQFDLLRHLHHFLVLITVVPASAEVETMPSESFGGLSQLFQELYHCEIFASFSLQFTDDSLADMCVVFEDENVRLVCGEEMLHNLSVRQRAGNLPHRKIRTRRDISSFDERVEVELVLGNGWLDLSDVGHAEVTEERLHVMPPFLQSDHVGGKRQLRGSMVRHEDVVIARKHRRGVAAHGFRIRV